MLVRSVGWMCLGCTLFAFGMDVGNLQPYDRGDMENLWPRCERDPYTDKEVLWLSDNQ